MREGEPGGDLWIVRTGMVEVFRERRGTRVPLAVIEAGEMLGTMTATSGAPRSASVRALTNGTATVIPKSHVDQMVAGLPSWALLLIKDLVGRVNYANELYIEVESHRGQFPQDHPLSFVRRFLRTLIALSDSIAVTAGEALYVPVDGKLSLISQALGDPEEAKIILDILFIHGLITSVENIGEGRHVRLEEIANLCQFADLIERIVADADLRGPFVMPFAINERKMLTELAETAMTQAEEEATIMSLKSLEDEFRRKNMEFEVETLVRAGKFGLLSLDKSGQTPSLTFDSHWLSFAMKCFNAIKDITDPRSGRTRSFKKTLLY